MLGILSLPILYIVISLLLSLITVDKKSNIEDSRKQIYLSTNGVHLDTVIPIEDVEKHLFSGVKHKRSDKYISFGWGDENFYINTPNWSDLTFNNAFKVIFLESSTLIHITRYRKRHSDWIEIKVNESVA